MVGAVGLLGAVLEWLLKNTIGSIIRMLRVVRLPKEDRGSLSWGFVGTLTITLAYGLVMLFSASYSRGYAKYGSIYHFIVPQLIVAVLGFVLMLFISHINYRALRYLKVSIYIVTCVLMVAALFSEDDTNGTYRWVYIFGMSIQPSELAKFALMLCTADVLDTHRDKLSTFRWGIVEPCIPLIPILVLLLLQSHKSGMMLMLLIWGTIMVCAGAGMRWWPVVGAAGGAALVAFFAYLANSEDYASVRLGGAWGLTPSTDGMLYQTRQSVYAIAGGGLFGAGIGNSVQKHQWLPYAENDFIFSVVCEELGFVGALAVLGLFAMLIVYGIVIALRAPDLYGKLLGIGIVSQVGWQVFLHIGVATALLPNTGISLPFFSYGGTSLLILLSEMGVLLSISRVGNARAAAREKAARAAVQRQAERRVYRRGEET